VALQKIAGALRVNTGLKRFDLSSNDIGVDGLKLLIEAAGPHPQITTLDLRCGTPYMYSLGNSY
jgi:hypothetical protein